MLIPLYSDVHLILNLSYISCDVNIKSRNTKQIHSGQLEKHANAIWLPPHTWTHSLCMYKCLLVSFISELRPIIIYL